MWPVPVKYKTVCYLNDSNNVISEHVFEAINKDEAVTRAYLNCIIENDMNTNVHVNAERRLF